MMEIKRKEFTRLLSQVETGDKIWIVSTVREVHKNIWDIALRLSELDFINYVRIANDEFSASSENYPNRPKVPVVHSGYSKAIGVQVLYNADRQYIDMFDINSPIKGNGSKLVEAILKDYPRDWSVYVTMDYSGGFWKAMSEKYSKIEWSI